jgi:dipeptidyl-peptidase-4
MKALQDARRPFELMTYPGSKHGLVRNADTGPHAFQTILDFFARVLPAAATAQSPKEN